MNGLLSSMRIMVPDKELKYLEPGDYFEDDRILMVSVKEKYV